jgi:hypothetical protein
MSGHEIQHLYSQLEADMLIFVKTLERVLILFLIILTTVQLAACGVAAPVPRATETVAPTSQLSTPSTTPSPIPTATSSPTNIPTATSDFCNSAQSQDRVEVISDNLLTTLGPGNPLVFDRILTEHDPAWADFRQTVHGEVRSAGVIFHETSAGPEPGAALNPAVILVIYGLERNWELPASGNLAAEAEHIRAVLFQHRSDWIHGQVDQSQYPVANAATYALYRYFRDDMAKLEGWCRTYVQVYDESPLK